MPIYEYSCSKCGKTIEVIQKMSDRPLRSHKDCGGKLTKLISASAFQFKGTGWYVTDYGKKSQSPESPSPSSESESKSKSKSDGKKESSTSETSSTTATAPVKDSKGKKDDGK